MKWFFALLCISIAFSLQAEPLNFKRALLKLEERNTDIPAQKARLKLSEAERLNQTAAFLPTVNARALDTQLTVPNFRQTQQGLLVGSLNLFRSGADLAGFRAGQAGVDRERHQLTSIQLESEQANVTLLIRYIQTAQQQRVAETLVKLNEEMAATESARYKRGLVPLQNSQKAVIESSNSLARYQDARARHEEARASLAAQLGPAELAIDWPWKKFLLVDRADKWIKRELELRETPAWRASQEAIEIENQLARARFRDFLPSLDLNLSFGYQDYLRSKETGWESSLILTIPLLDFKKHSAYRSQIQREALAKIEQERVKRTLLGQWQETREKLFLALKSAGERETSREMAQSLYHDNQRRLRAGRSSLNDLVVDQNRLADAEILAVNGWAEAHLLYARLCHVLGLRVNLDGFGCRPAE